MESVDFGKMKRKLRGENRRERAEGLSREEGGTKRRRGFNERLKRCWY